MARDQRVGAALRELQAPEHGPDFWERLEAELESQPSERRAAQRPPSRRPLRLGFAAVAAATIAAATIVLRLDEAPERALAEVVQERVGDAVAGLEEIRGRGIFRSRDDPPMRFSFTLRADGDVSFRDDSTAIAYDSERGVERRIIDSDSRHLDTLYVERRGVAPGPPDLTTTEVPPQQQLGAAIRALLAADDPRVTEATWEGREVWRAVISLDPERSFGAIDQLGLVVDQETGLPVRSRGSRDGRLVYETRVDRLDVNSGLPEHAFTLRFPPAADVAVNKEGFDRVTPAEAGARAGYDPLVPGWVPEGYELVAVAVAERDRFTGPAPESGQGNRRGLDVISLAYRRGFDQLTVTTRRAGGRPEAWIDPFRATIAPAEPEPVTLADGALTGARAQVVADPQTLPHLWALDDGLLLTVGGNLSRDELLHVAESLGAG